MKAIDYENIYRELEEKEAGLLCEHGFSHRDYYIGGMSAAYQGAPVECEVYDRSHNLVAVFEVAA